MNYLNLFTKCTALMIFCFAISTGCLTAQKEISEGHLILKITDVKMPGMDSDNPEMSMAMDMMKGGKMEIFFTEEKELVITDMMGGMAVTRSLNNYKENTSVTYMDMMGQKMKVDVGDIGNAGQDDVDMEVKSDKSDRKTIAGFDCYKVDLIMNMEGQEITITTYVTERIQMRSSVVQGIQKNPLPGMVLRMDMNVQGMVMVYEASEFNEKFDDSVFEIDDTQYKEMSMEDLQRMGGGMGF